MITLGSLQSQSFKQWKLAQFARHETFTKILGPQVQSLIDGTSLLNLFCSNTIISFRETSINTPTGTQLYLPIYKRNLPSDLRGHFQG